MLDITVSVAKGLTIVGLKGGLVRGQGDYLIEVVGWLRQTGERRIVLHAAGVSTVDNDGLVALMQCHAALIGSGGCLVIKMPSDQLRLALRRTGLEAVLHIVNGPDPDSRNTSVREV